MQVCAIFHEPNPRWIASKINRIKMVAPDETVVEFGLVETGYILDRRIFDYDLAQYAAQEGAQIVTKAYVDGLIIKDDKVAGVKGIHLGERFEKKAKIVVGADGVESRVGRWAGLQTHLKLKDMESGIQKTVAGIEVTENMFEFYLSKNGLQAVIYGYFLKGKIKQILVWVSLAIMQKTAKQHINFWMSSFIGNIPKLLF